MAILYLIRHGETDWNRDRRIQGQSDTPLNDEGREQSRLLGRRLSGTGFDAAFASDLSRAIETAELILECRDLPLTTDPGLRERAFGRWEGLEADQAAARDPERWEAWRNRFRDVSPPGGESQTELETRVTAALQSIADRHHPDDTLLVVSHGGAIQGALRSWFGLDGRPIVNCGGAILEVAGSEKRVIDRIEP
jgi:2,3-bisphosphoglycerate-dependent phosphoglycerate mutase